MGLSASQARFLGITLRKANCEFKSTELAQQRLELTNQMTDISQEYANALNATKLVWHNEAVCDSFGNPSDFGLSYSLLMMPSAANDYNPYMVSTRSGAIVLNSKYADAAEYAGISMAGGIPSQAGRDRFLAALANISGAQPANPRAAGDKNNNVITEKTYRILSGEKVDVNSDISWHYSAGMGAAPKEKGLADVTTLSDLIADDNIGGKTLDWLQIYKAALGITNGTTEIERSSDMQVYKDYIASAKLNYINHAQFTKANSSDLFEVNQDKTYDNTYVTDIENAARGEITGYSNGVPTVTGIMKKFYDLEVLIDKASDDAAKIQYKNELEQLKKGYQVVQSTGGRDVNPIDNDAENTLKYPLYWAVYEEAKAKAKSSAVEIKWNTTNDGGNGAFDATSVSVKQLFYTGNDGIGGAGSDGNKGMILRGLVEKPAVDYFNILTLCVNNTMVRDSQNIKNMTLADLLTEDVTIMAQNTPPRDGGVSYSDAKKTVEVAARAMLTSIAEAFGYGHVGTALNVDLDADKALNQAYDMTVKKFINPTNAVNSNKYDDDALLSNGAYVNAQEYNRMGVLTDSDTGYAAINLSNMLSAFLTYFDNYLRGSDSQYVVGKGNIDGKTAFVTDDPSYVYVTSPKDGVTNDEKIADFFNELYNNICHHGWRHDDMVQDNEYLESAVKDGRYQLMALNNDGYFYQMRYNEIGYMEEVQDTDAIARAESDYKVKKAQITFKEDQIDVKTKKLDAEITELTTEINSVQNIISKAIEKTFTMFSN